MLFVAWAWLIRGCPAALPIGFVLLLPWSFGMLVLTMPPFFGEPGMEEALPGPPVFLMLALAWGLAGLGSLGTIGDDTLAR